jgi:galactose mutarotase-like enzyme
MSELHTDPGSITQAIERAVRPHHVYELQSGDVTAHVLQTGGAIRDLTIDGRVILVSSIGAESEESALKQPALTHTTFPHGTIDEGIKHGSSRYAEYETGFRVANKLSLLAVDRTANLGHEKQISINPDGDGILITDTLVNLGSEEHETSLGEHPYFKINEESIEDIRILAEWESDTPQEMDVIREDGTLLRGVTFDRMVPYILAGEAILVDSSHYSMRLSIDDGRDIAITAFARVDNEIEPVRWLFWYRPGTDTLCVEPVLGLVIDSDATLYNRELQLLPSQEATLQTGITLRTEKSRLLGFHPARDLPGGGIRLPNDSPFGN